MTQISTITNKNYTFEDLLEEIGGHGRFQKRLLWVYLAPISFLLPMISMTDVFLMSVPKFQCDIALFEHMNLTLTEIGYFRDNFVTKDQCWYNKNASKDPLLWRKLNKSLTDGQLVKCDHFVFDKKIYEFTVSTQWKLVCDQEHLPSLLFTMTSLSQAFGTVILGRLADTWGRRRIFFISTVLIFIGSMFSSFAETFTMFLVMRLIRSVTGVALYQVPYILTLELLTSNQRTVALGISFVFWTLGLAFLPAVVWWSRNWMTLTHISATLTISFLLYYKWLPESPRWQLSLGQIDNSIESLRRIAEENRSSLPDNIVEKLALVERKIEAQKNDQMQAWHILVKHSGIRKHIFLIIVCYIGNVFVYSLLHLNVTHITGNELLNTFYLCIAEMLANIVTWIGMDRFGRRWLNVFSQMLCAAVCIVPFFWRETFVDVVVSFIAKFACCISFMIMYQQCAELMPTNCRTSAIGIAGATAGFVNILMPYTVYLGKYGSWIPFLVCALLATLAAVCSSCLPETLGYNICHTVDEAETFGKNQKFFAMNIGRNFKQKKLIDRNYS